MKLTISQMRQFIIDRYPDNLAWHSKVLDMKPNRVIAIYKKMVETNYKKRTNDNYHQIDIFEYLATKKQNHTEIEV